MQSILLHSDCSSRIHILLSLRQSTSVSHFSGLACSHPFHRSYIKPPFSQGLHASPLKSRLYTTPLQSTFNIGCVQSPCHMWLHTNHMHASFHRSLCLMQAHFHRVFFPQFLCKFYSNPFHWGLHASPIKQGTVEKPMLVPFQRGLYSILCSPPSTGGCMQTPFHSGLHNPMQGPFHG